MDQWIYPMIIGIDDTDSKEGMCTTYLGAVLIEKLKRYGTIEGYPLLVRLNPNIKYKTRGNAAVAFQLELKNIEYTEVIKRLVIETVENMAIFSDENTNPGIVFIEEYQEEMKNDLASFSLRAVQDVLEIHEAEELLDLTPSSPRRIKLILATSSFRASGAILLISLPDFTFE